MLARHWYPRRWTADALGTIGHCTLKSLRRLSPMHPARRDRADLPSVEEGFTWACQPVLGASSCLSPGRGARYLASDYLLDRTQTGLGPLAGTVVSDEVWNALLAIDDPEEIASVGVHAHWAGRQDLAEAAYRIATEAGEAGGIMNLGPLLAAQGRMDEAEEHWRRAAHDGWHDANVRACCDPGTTR